MIVYVHGLAFKQKLGKLADDHGVYYIPSKIHDHLRLLFTEGPGDNNLSRLLCTTVWHWNPKIMCDVRLVGRSG